jgi:hypothetical protein
MVPTLKRLVAERALKQPPSDLWVQWAVAQLSAGQDTPHLRILAGERAPFYYPEMSALLDKVLEELGQPLPSRDTAIREYASELATLLVGSKGRDLEPLRQLRDLCIACEHSLTLNDFYLLAFAAEDLARHGDQHYWEGATSANLPDIVLDKARMWLIDETAHGTA